MTGFINQVSKLTNSQVCKLIEYYRAEEFERAIVQTGAALADVEEAIDRAGRTDDRDALFDTSCNLVAPLLE